jgi:probable phosphoglycerate mutase
VDETTRICVARHGETDWNTSGVLQGWLDVPLNEQGRTQARELARSFAESRFSCVYTSPLSRSAETADIIARDLGLPLPMRHEGLKERSFGVVQGIPKAELAELNPALLQHILRRDPTSVFEQGESMDECATRVLGAITDIARENPGKRVLVITHGWAMDVVARQVRGLPRTAILHRKPVNGECLWLVATADVIGPLRSEDT